MQSTVLKTHPTFTGEIIYPSEDGEPMGVPNHWQHSYKIWEEGKGPDIVIEILSRKTWKKDVQQNPKLKQAGLN